MKLATQVQEARLKAGDVKIGAIKGGDLRGGSPKVARLGSTSATGVSLLVS